MGIFNKRNAAVGWLALLVGKRVAKRKAKNAIPSGTKAKAGAGAVGAVAAAGGALLFWKKRRGKSGSDPELGR